MDRGAWRTTVHGVAHTIESFQLVASTKTKKGEGLNPTWIQGNPRFLPVMLLGSDGPLQPNRYFWASSCPDPDVGHCGPLRKGKTIPSVLSVPETTPPQVHRTVFLNSQQAQCFPQTSSRFLVPQVCFLEAMFCRPRITLLPWETASPTHHVGSKSLFPFPTAKPKGLYSNPSLAQSNHPSTHLRDGKPPRWLPGCLTQGPQELLQDPRGDLPSWWWSKDAR